MYQNYAILAITKDGFEFSAEFQNSIVMGQGIPETKDAFEIYALSVATAWFSMLDELPTGKIIIDKAVNLGFTAAIKYADELKNQLVGSSPLGFHANEIISHAQYDKHIARYLEILQFPKRFAYESQEPGTRPLIEAEEKFCDFITTMRPTTFFMPNERTYLFTGQNTTRKSVLMQWLRVITSSIREVYIHREMRTSPGSTVDAGRNRFLKLAALAKDCPCTNGNIIDKGVNPHYSIQAATPSIVPKNYKTGRVVAVRTTYEQALCYMVADNIYENLQVSSIYGVPWCEIIPDARSEARNHLFDPQTVNRENLSDLSIASVDFSSASDAIYPELIEQAFPALYTFVTEELKVRPLKISHPDKKVKKVFRNSIWKMMGDADCFPTEEIVHASIAVLAVVVYETLQGGGRADTYKRIQQGIRTITVFGDDCQIHVKYFQLFMDLASLFGLIPNREKSFGDIGRSPFDYRESCGFESVNGFVFQSVKCPRLPEPKRNITPRAQYTLDLISLQHRLLYKNYVSAATLISHYVRILCPKVTYTSYDEFLSIMQDPRNESTWEYDPIVDLVSTGEEASTLPSPHVVFKVISCVTEDELVMAYRLLKNRIRVDLHRDTLHCISNEVPNQMSLLLSKEFSSADDAKREVEKLYSLTHATKLVSMALQDKAWATWVPEKDQFVYEMGLFKVVSTPKSYQESFIDNHSFTHTRVPASLGEQELQRANDLGYHDFLTNGRLVVETEPTLGIEITQSQMQQAKSSLYGVTDI